MKTVSVNVMDLCAPCANRCRYCLLSYNGCVSGVAPERAMDYARRFAAWLRESRPEVSFLFGWGYSMEHPQLVDMIRCARELNCITGQFLQFDGMDFRTGPELKTFLRDLKNAGIRVIDLTFYGSEEYHDRFAARKGDHRLMMDTPRPSAWGMKQATRTVSYLRRSKTNSSNWPRFSRVSGMLTETSIPTRFAARSVSIISR